MLDASMLACAQVLCKYGVKEEELLHMLNTLPTTEVELFLLMDHCDERLTEEERSMLLEELGAARAQRSGEETHATGNARKEEAEAPQEAEAAEAHGKKAEEEGEGGREWEDEPMDEREAEAEGMEAPEEQLVGMETKDKDDMEEE